MCPPPHTPLLGVLTEIPPQVPELRRPVPSQTLTYTHGRGCSAGGPEGVLPKQPGLQRLSVCSVSGGHVCPRGTK